MGSVAGQTKPDTESGDQRSRPRLRVRRADRVRDVLSQADAIIEVPADRWDVESSSTGP